MKTGTQPGASRCVTLWMRVWAASWVRGPRWITGSSLANYEVWDGIRAFDYLLTRSDVDPKRIAVAGNSGGGTQSAYLAALEPRLASAAPSCFLTSSEKLWTDLGPQDAEQNIIGFLSSGLDLKDFALAFAPRFSHEDL